MKGVNKMNIKPLNLTIAIDKTGISIDHPKNTFSRKAKDATSSMVRKYYKSLDSEARARLEYAKFQKAESELDDIPTDSELKIKDILKGVKLFFKMANHKLNSVVHETDSFHYFPERFYEPDNPKAFPERHYKLSSPSRTLPWE